MNLSAFQNRSQKEKTVIIFLNLPKESFYRPIARSRMQDPNILVSKPGVILDSIQQQMASFLTLFLEEQAAHKARQDELD